MFLLLICMFWLLMELCSLTHLDFILDYDVKTNIYFFSSDYSVNITYLKIHFILIDLSYHFIMYCTQHIYSSLSLNFLKTLIWP